MLDETFICTCLADTADGLRDGLSHFCGPSRTAVIYAIELDSPVCIYDPQNLLKGHEPRLKELFIDTEDWRNRPLRPFLKNGSFHIVPEKNLQLAGIISCGGRSSSVFYQMWFTEHHPDMCAVGPSERWLEHAAWRFSHDIANQKGLYTGISGSFLREYATHAVRDFIVDEMNLKLGMDTQLRVYPILDAILGIFNTREEGAWPRGQLIFIDPSVLSRLSFVARFPEMEQPDINNSKHVRKLLQAVEQSERKLVSQGSTIIGISNEIIKDFCIVADFRGRHGFIRLNGEAVCSFSDGVYKSTTHQAKLVQVEEALLETPLDSEIGNRLYQIVCSIVHHAEGQKFGCTLIIDLNEKTEKIVGQKLLPPLDLREDRHLELARSLAKVDGALHIGQDLKLHAFACLLDGRSIPGEDRARGARYNSALRFTYEHKNILVVVVSSDRPISVIQEGVEISAQCQWNPVSACRIGTTTLEAFIDG
jgi:DNA integrity scanning protein DisA with diadenylate cyclase activity